MTSQWCEDDGYNFTWIIKNGNLCALQPHKWIGAPVLAINFMLTEWKIHLRCVPDESEEWITIYLQRNFDDGPECVEILVKDLTLSGTCLETVGEPMELCFKKSDLFQILKCKRHPDGDIVNALSPSNDTVEIRFTLIPVLETLECSDLHQFSNDMKELFLGENFCDTLLRSGDTEIKIHRAILEARAYGLHIGEKNFDHNVLYAMIPQVDESVLRELFQFLYSAHVTTNSATRDELVATAETLGIQNLDEKYLGGPCNWRAETMLRRRRKCIRVTIPTVDSDTRNQRSFILMGIPWRFTFHFSKFHNTELVHIKLSPNVRVNLSFGVSTVNVRLVSIMEDFNGSVLGKKTRYWKLKNESNKSIELNLKYKKKDAGLQRPPTPMRTFFFTMDALYGNNSSNSKATYIKSYTRNPLSDIMILGADISRLFENEMFADLTIIVSDGRLSVHKAILSARSPVFAEMIQDNPERDEIFVEEFDRNVMEIFFQHMYGSQVVFQDYDVTIHLALAAYKYGMKIFMERCLNYLIENLAVNGAFDVYVLLDFLDSEAFKNVTKQFIRGNICVVCEEEFVEDFKTNYPFLFVEVFEERKCICASFERVSGDIQENDSADFKRPDSDDGESPLTVTLD